MVDLDNAINGMIGVATIGVVAGATERIINGRRVVKKKSSKRRYSGERIRFW